MAGWFYELKKYILGYTGRTLGSTLDVCDDVLVYTLCEYYSG